ncbi:MAG TPA: ATP-binding cassette domain-containing protein [Streptosporangiaceae bacterium]|nr:ATP-binding cassette domain-containing protein [Streptosporangiaceae bacterium]HEX5301814.1 ATP-binding cassette domain-containing protein [Streptosporangiaceae bacterium]
MVAALTRRFVDLDIAEAFATAVERWPPDGVPPSPGAWLTTTANRKAIDRIIGGFCVVDVPAREEALEWLERPASGLSGCLRPPRSDDVAGTSGERRGGREAGNEHAGRRGRRVAPLPGADRAEDRRSGGRGARAAKKFGAKEAVAGIDLQVAAGSLAGLVGPNGAGKTTSLSMMTGLLRPDSDPQTRRCCSWTSRWRAWTRCPGT